jgi:hypothetical protein
MELTRFYAAEGYHLEFAEDVTDVRLDGFFADEEGFSHCLRKASINPTVSSGAGRRCCSIASISVMSF